MRMCKMMHLFSILTLSAPPSLSPFDIISGLVSSSHPSRSPLLSILLSELAFSKCPLDITKYYITASLSTRVS